MDQFISNQNLNNEEFNLKIFISLLIRNKIFIASFSILSFFLACLYAINLKRVWMGQFEIVLENKNENPNNSQLSSLLKLTSFNKAANSLSTEVGILQSQAVLMPVYEFVSEQKKKKDPNYKPGIFSIWKNKNFQIDLIEKTSIVRISYIDTDKSLIVPTLEKTSKVYQGYSGKNKKRQQELTKNYLKEQISKFKIKSSESLKAAQDYAFDKDLSILQSFANGNSKINNKMEISIDKSPDIFAFSPNIDIERVRLEAIKEIRTIEEQIKKIEEMGDDINKIKYISFSIPGFDKENSLSNRIASIEEELLKLRSIYKDNDLAITDRKQARDMLIKLLKQRSLGYLNSLKIAAEAKMQSATRPKEVLFKYKDLLRQSARDENTLIRLEDNLRVIQLEEAKIEDPWQLITKPTLLINPVAPNRKRIGLLGLLGGLILSSSIAYLKEKKSGILYDLEIIENIFETKTIEKIKEFNKNSLSNEFLFLEELLKTKIKEKVSIIPLGNNLTKDLNNISQFIDFMNEKYKQKNNWIFLNNKIEEITNAKYNLLLVNPGFLTIYDAKDLNKILKNLNQNISGILVSEIIE